MNMFSTFQYIHIFTLHFVNKEVPYWIGKALCIYCTGKYSIWKEKNCVKPIKAVKKRNPFIFTIQLWFANMFYIFLNFIYLICHAVDGRICNNFFIGCWFFWCWSLMHDMNKIKTVEHCLNFLLGIIMFGLYKLFKLNLRFLLFYIYKQKFFMHQIMQWI